MCKKSDEGVSIFLNRGYFLYISLFCYVCMYSFLVTFVLLL